MAAVRAAVEVAAPADRAWSRLVDWPAHGRWVPCTVVTVTSARADGPGASFVGRTRLGPLRFEDPMTVCRWEPPAGGRDGRCVVRKTGRVLRGRAAFGVVALPGGRSRVWWEEDVEVGPARLARPLAPVVRLVGAGFARLVLRRFAREIDRLSATGHVP